MTVTAHLKWTQELQFVARVDQAPAIVMDTSEGGSGPSPMQLVLMGVAGCTAMDVVSILRKKRSPFIDVKVNVSAERAAQHPRRYTRIDLEYVITGHGLREKDVATAIELSLTKYCSATASLNAAVTSQYRIVA